MTVHARRDVGLAALVVVLCGVSAFAAPATGQDLGEIDRLGADGRTADARDALVSWLDVEWGDASRSERERALWLRGVLTLDPVAASATYRRLVVEYPAGGYSEPALARLGSLSAAVGDTLGAARWFTVLARDYPRSSEASTASTWLTAHSGAVARAEARGPVPVAATETSSSSAATETTVPDAPPTGGSGRETSPPEQTPDSIPTSDAPPDAIPTPDALPDSLPDSPRGEGDWTVQLGAFSSEASARQIAEEVRAAGFEVRLVLVEGSDLWRIRSGRFVEDDDARPLAARMIEAGFQAAVVPGADDEVGGG